MNSNARLWMLASLLALSDAAAQETFPWAADFRTACEMAADERRLVLLHFYNDNCEPCVRLERNVFSQPNVGRSVAQNYIPVKVHAGRSRELATRYQVALWPTDVIVTPSGLEVFRMISPQQPAEYVAALDRIAQQTGISAGRQWASRVEPVSQPVLAGASSFEETAKTARHGVAGTDDARRQIQQQGATPGQQSGAMPPQWVGTPTPGAGTVEVSAAAAPHFSRPSPYAPTQWRGAQPGARSSSQLPPLPGGSPATAAPIPRQTPLSRSYDAFADGRTLAASTPWASQGTSDPVIPAANLQPAVVQQAPAFTGPPAPTENPWIMARPSPARIETASPPLTQPPPASVEAPQRHHEAKKAEQAIASVPTIPAKVVQPPPVVATPIAPIVDAAPRASESASPLSAGGLPVVPASQAPPPALDGFCSVTLVETVARDPGSRAAWKKGDPNFGAVHRGRTYLFSSAAEQQKFLHNPDAYAPILSGYDPVRYAETGQLVEGKRAYGVRTPDQRLVLFADEESLNKFSQWPGRYTSAVRQAMVPSGASAMYR